MQSTDKIFVASKAPYVAAEILKAVKEFIESSRDLVSTPALEEINLQADIGWMRYRIPNKAFR